MSILFAILIRAYYSKSPPGRLIEEGSAVVPSNKTSVLNVLVLNEKNVYTIGKKYGSTRGEPTCKIECVLGSSRVCSLF